MFTGLIETTGTLLERAFEGEAGRLRIQADGLSGPVQVGDSVAVEGVCLTATDFTDHVLSFDVLAETFHRTNLGRKRDGSRMNLERALQHGSRLGGHIVNGHVDGVGSVVRFDEVDRDWVLGIACDREIAEGIVYKGCVSCNGVSLTVASVTDEGFEMHLIPETLEVTSLSELTPGDPVNLEIDIIGKYVRHYLEQGLVLPGVSWEQLRATGLLPE